MTELFRIEDLKVHFQARKGFLGSVVVRALDGVSLNLERGETLAVVGESGSGKTTLGRAALRLLRPTGGRIFFDGEDIGQTQESRLKEFRRRAQGVFQDPYSSIDPFMSIAQTLEEPLVIHGYGSADERTALVHQSLEDVNLSPAEETAAKYPHMLSGGQRQRVGHRAGPHPQAGLHPRGRAGIDDRCVQPGGDPVPDAGLAEDLRDNLPVHHPRHRDGAPLLRQDSRDVRRAHCGDGAFRQDH